MDALELQDVYLHAFRDQRNMFYWNCEKCDNYYYTEACFASGLKQLKRALSEYESGIANLCFELPVICHECLSFLCVNCVYAIIADASRKKHECVTCSLCDASISLQTLGSIADDDLGVLMIDTLHEEF